MNSIEIAKHAILSTAGAGKFVSEDVREKLAIAEAAIIVSNMDESISAATRMHRLNESINEIRVTLARD